jgi:hypothetical protein
LHPQALKLRVRSEGAAGLFAVNKAIADNQDSRT